MEGKESAPLKVDYKDGDFTVVNERAGELHSASYYGEFSAGKLKLSPIEALHLLERSRIKVYEDDREVGFAELAQRLMKKDPRNWLKYLIYSDLRKRGYIVKEGFSSHIEFRVYRRGAEVGEEGARYLVYGVIEDEPLDLSRLYEMVRNARMLRKEPVLAMVSKQGEVCYYQCSLVSL